MDEGHRVLGTVTSVSYGDMDCGFTCYIGIDFKGYYQSFGNIFLDEKKTGPQFRQSICDLFGINTKNWEQDLVGKQCYGLYCFAYNNEPLEGLEVDGKKFTITEFARRFDECPSPLERKRKSYESEIVHFERRMAETKRYLAKLDSEYKSWE